MDKNNNSTPPEPKNKKTDLPPPPPSGSNPNPGRRIPVSLFFWLSLIVLIGVLLAFKSDTGGLQKRTISQTDFENDLRKGLIISVKSRAESDRIINIEGERYISEAAALAAAAGKTEQGVSAGADRVPYKSRVIYSERLENLMSEAHVKRDVETRDNWWSMLLTIVPIILIIGLFYFLFSRQLKMAGRGAMQFGKSRARMIMPNELKITFDDIAGVDEAREEISEIISFLKDPLKFKMVGGKIPKGCLLMGPPGTGKTLLAKAVAAEANVQFFSISGSDFVEMFVGVGASRVRDMFEQARKHMPSLIFIDEIDAVGRSRFSGLGGGHDEREQTLNAMLVEMDGLETQAGVIVIAATNRPDVLDPALLRPGRFDRQIVLDLPDIKGRRQILNVHVKNIRIADGVNLDLIAKTTAGFSGADLANLCNEAALLAARNDRDSANQEDLEEARDKVRWGRERRSRKISDRERRLTAYHEAGHTLMAMYCEHATPVHKVTIIPRGRAYLGATMTMPLEDSYTESRNELLDELAVLMGGRVAEELVFKDVTSGAAGDIEHASRIARLMVCAFGMTEEIGPIRYGDLTNPVHVRADQGPGDGYSQETAARIDVQIQKIIGDALTRTRKLLSEHLGDLEKLAQELLEKESLTGNEVRALLGLPPQKNDDPVETGESQDIMPTGGLPDVVIAPDSFAPKNQ